MPYVTPEPPPVWVFTFDEVQDAYVDGRITLEQLIEVMLDNFGHIRTKVMLRKTLKVAFREEGDPWSMKEINKALALLGL